MKKTMFLIMLIMALGVVGCDYVNDSNGEKSFLNVQGSNINQYPQHVDEINGECFSEGKMGCIENSSVVCMEGIWVEVNNCSEINKICYFNNPEHTIFNIPYYATCD